MKIDEVQTQVAAIRKIVEHHLSDANAGYVVPVNMPGLVWLEFLGGVEAALASQCPAPDEHKRIDDRLVGAAEF